MLVLDSVCVYVHMYTCVYMYMCVHMYVCVYTCVYRSGNNLRCWALPSTVFETVSLVVCNCMPRLVGLEDLGVFCLYSYITIGGPGWQMCVTTSAFMWLLRCELRSACLYSKCFMNHLLGPAIKNFCRRSQFNQEASTEMSCNLTAHETSLPSLGTINGSHFGFFLVF